MLKGEKRKADKHRKLLALSNLMLQKDTPSSVVSAKDFLSKNEKQNWSAKGISEMQRAIRQHQKDAVDVPKLFLIDEFKSNDLSCNKLFMSDLQQLLIFALAGNQGNPRFCKLVKVGSLKCVVTILLDGISYHDITEQADSFVNTFSMKTELVTPLLYGSEVTTELFTVPLSGTKLYEKCKREGVHFYQKKAELVAMALKRGGQLEAAAARRQDVLVSDRFSRRQLLLSQEQMAREGYPVPAMQDERQKDFVFTKDCYKPVTDDSPMLAIDCEMVYTTSHENELARVTVVNEKHEVVYDSLVKPRNRVVSYLTKYSGITREMLDPVQTRIEDVQLKLREILPPDAILVGHSLCFDLKALKIFHPYVIDSAVVYNISGERHRKTALRHLTKMFLGRTIQNHGADGHCSAEDSIASLELVQIKLRNSPEFGDVIRSRRPVIHDMAPAAGTAGTSQPSTGQPSTGQPSIGQPSTGQPSIGQPSTGQPSTGQPSTSQPSTSQPSTSQPSTSQPSTSQPSTGQPSAQTETNSPDRVAKVETTDTGDKHQKSKLNGNQQSLKRKAADESAEVSSEKKQKHGSGAESRPVLSPEERAAQLRVFYSNTEAMHAENLLLYPAGRHRTVRIIDDQRGCDVIRACGDEPAPMDTTTFVTCTSDKEVTRDVITHLDSTFYTWAALRHCARQARETPHSAEKLQSYAEKMDRRVQRMVSCLPPRCLVMVVLSGRLQPGNVRNAGCFVKIT